MARVGISKSSPPATNSSASTRLRHFERFSSGFSGELFIATLIVSTDPIMGCVLPAGKPRCEGSNSQTSRGLGKKLSRGGVGRATRRRARLAVDTHVDETTKNTAGMRVNVNFTQLQFLKAYPEQQIICHLLASRPPRAVG